MATLRRCAVFAGQGTQAAGMAAPYLPNAGFMQAVEACSAAYAAHRPDTAWDLRQAMETCDGVDDTVIGQPLLSALQIGLVHGQAFDYVVGHSLGEIAAAHAAGILTTHEAMGVIYYRSMALQHARGEMAVALCPAEKALAVLEETGLVEAVSVAASNDARSTTLCGAALGDARAALKAQRIVTKPVPVKYAFHSPLISEGDVAALEENLTKHVFTRSPEEVRMAASPGTRYYPTGLLSQAALCAPNALETYRGALGTFDAYSPAYWARQIRHPVGFSVALRAAAGDVPDGDSCTAVEVSPTPVLGRFVAPHMAVEELVLAAA